MQHLPSVTAVMLVDGRHDMVAAAVQSFTRQSYPKALRYLLLWDSGYPHYAPTFVYDPHGIEIWHRRRGPTVGSLRNEAITESRGDVIVHFDSDDLSHPDRISEQVALLIASGADCVGFREMIFWDTRIKLLKEETISHPPDCTCGSESLHKGPNTWLDYGPTNEAWLYYHAHPNYVLGGSMCYWRKTWERVPFPDKQTGEDVDWLLSGVHAIGAAIRPMAGDDPRMVCRIHGANTSAASYDPRLLAGAQGGDKHWQRRPEFDEFCRKIFGSNSERGPK